jgi:hypothetical protein
MRELFILPSMISAQMAGFKPDRCHRQMPEARCMLADPTELERHRGIRYDRIYIDTGCRQHMSRDQWDRFTQEIRGWNSHPDTVWMEP